jgi:hypothetical protein
MKAIIKKFFCDSEGNFKVPYFWATVFLASFAAVIAAGVLTGTERPVATTTLGGMAMGMILLYNNGKRK